MKNKDLQILSAFSRSELLYIFAFCATFATFHLAHNESATFRNRTYPNEESFFLYHAPIDLEYNLTISGRWEGYCAAKYKRNIVRNMRRDSVRLWKFSWRIIHIDIPWICVRSPEKCAANRWHWLVAAQAFVKSDADNAQAFFTNGVQAIISPVYWVLSWKKFSTHSLNSRVLFLCQSHRKSVSDIRMGSQAHLEYNKSAHWRAIHLWRN